MSTSSNYKEVHDMKKLINWKRVVSVGLIFCNVAMISVPTLAVSSPKESTVQIEEISLRYRVLRQITATLSIASNGKLTCRSSISALPTGSFDATVELQQEDNSRWSTIEEWTYHGVDLEFNESYYAKTGFDYRLKVSVDGYNFNGQLVERPIVYSNVVSY